MSLILSGSDGLSDVDGSAATPAIRGTDANTGIFFGADIIGFSEGGAECARFNADSQFVSAAGTASLPVLTTTGDLNTGVYFPGADRIGFATGGSQRGEFDASGNFQFNSGYGSVATAYGCRAWVNFNGTSTVAIRASGNVTSITDNGTGDYTVNFSTAITDANYSFVAFCKTSSGAQNRTAFANGDNGNTTQSTSSYRFYTTTLAGTPTDTDFINVAVFR